MSTNEATPVTEVIVTARRLPTTTVGTEWDYVLPTEYQDNDTPTAYDWRRDSARRRSNA